MIASTDGNVTLDTGTFAHKDLQDFDRKQSIKVEGSVDLPGIGSKGGDDNKATGNTGSGGKPQIPSSENGKPTVTDKGGDDKAPPTAMDIFMQDVGNAIMETSVGIPKVTYDSATTEGTSRATIAAANGDVQITVRDDSDMDLSKLNRDLNQAQTIDVDRTTSMTLDWDKGIIFGLIELPFFDKKAWNFQSLSGL